MKFKIVSVFALPIIAVCTSAPALSATSSISQINLDQGTGSVEFHASGHPSSLKIVGKGDKPKGAFRVDGRHVTGVARFDLTSLDTGIDMRTRHMKEKYLEVQKYGEAVLTVAQMELPAELRDGGRATQVPFTGKLKLHGVEHPVSGTADVSESGANVALNAQFGLRLADYAIALPSFAGITVADDVQVLVNDSAPVSTPQSVARSH